MGVESVAEWRVQSGEQPDMTFGFQALNVQSSTSSSQESIPNAEVYTSFTRSSSTQSLWDWMVRDDFI
jgi:hypothetical protein